MAEFIRTEEKVINVDEPVIFENNTDSDFSVSAAIVFRKSGLYDVSIAGSRTMISKVAKRKKGKWIMNDNGTYSCSICSSWIPEEQYDYARYCLYCGADMRGE